jgi:acetyl esterase/lipase
VLLEARGVNPSFSPLRVPEGLTAPGFLGDIRRRFIIGIPAFRGETLIVGGDTLRADGDPGDSWDGATDDLLAFLNVVLLAVPAASPDRVAIFGRSRGAAVAMLAAERDTRIGAVVAWAGPVDWFEAMGQTGWSVREAVADGLRVRANRFGPGGQFIATFLSRALDGHASLAACRRLMIASSPLWFAERLPLTKVHYGVDDGIVPERNGRLLAQRLADSDRTRECFRAWFHENAGHDQDLFQAPRESRRLLEQWAAGERRCTPRATRTLGTR